MGDISKLRPRQPGWYEFKGHRTTPSGKFLVMIHDVVKVVSGRGVGTSLVMTAGSKERYSTEMYEGTWELVRAEIKEPA
jgi:hypothetical protein